MIRKSLSALVALTLCATLFNGCGKKKEDDKEESDPASVAGGGGGSGGSGSGSLAAAVPGALALAVFPQASTGASLIQNDQVEDPNKNKTVADKVADNQARLDGTASSCLNVNVFKRRMRSPSPNCYEFDSGMNPFQLSGQSQTRGSKTGLDDTGNEACMVAFARNEIDDTVERVDQAMEMISGMVCQAKKNGSDAELAVGDSLDLKAALETAAAGALPITVAKITRLADDADGSAVYHSRIEFAFPDGRTSELNLVNSTAAGVSKGTLSFLRAGAAPAADGQQQQQDPNNDQNKHDLMSINYSRTLDDAGQPRMQFEARFARMTKDITPFDDAGLLNFGGLNQEAANSTVHAIKYVAFDMNPDTNEGALSYWMNPGGNYNESARGFLFNIEKNDEGVLVGCGTSGATAGLSIRKAVMEPSEDNTLKPVRDWQPQWAQNVHADKDARFTAGETNVVTEQCFKQNQTSGYYEIDAEKTTGQGSGYGYDVKQVAEVQVMPPARPEKKFEGEVPLE
jgi:hypothetical protein